MLTNDNLCYIVELYNTIAKTHTHSNKIVKNLRIYKNIKRRKIKIKFFVFNLTILTLHLVSAVSVFGYELSNEKDYPYSHIVDFDNYFYEDENYVIVGNNYDIKSEDVVTFQEEYINKQLLIYFFVEYHGDIRSYEYMIAIKYYYVMGEINTAFLGTSSTDKIIIKDEIYDFFIEDLTGETFTELNLANMSNAQ